MIYLLEVLSLLPCHIWPWRIAPHHSLYSSAIVSASAIRHSHWLASTIPLAPTYMRECFLVVSQSFEESVFEFVEYSWSREPEWRVIRWELYCMKDSSWCWTEQIGGWLAGHIIGIIPSPYIEYCSGALRERRGFQQPRTRVTCLVENTYYYDSSK